MKNFIQKLQNKPIHVRKRILWTIVIITGLILAVLWIFIVSKSLREINKEDVDKQLNLPTFQENLDNTPKLEIPEQINNDIE